MKIKYEKYSDDDFEMITKTLNNYINSTQNLSLKEEASKSLKIIQSNHNLHQLPDYKSKKKKKF